MPVGWVRLEFSAEVCRLVYLLGALRNDDDDDGSENVTKKKEFCTLSNFRELYCVYLESLDSSNVGDFSWSWILKPGFIHVQIEKGKHRKRGLDFLSMFFKTYKELDP